MISLDLNVPINQVRLLIGDIESEFISNDNLHFVLDKNNGSVLRSAIESLGYILSIVSYYVREEAGDVEVYWQDLYNQLAERKKELEKEAAYSNSGSLFHFGGTTKSEINRVKDSPETPSRTYQSGEFLRVADSLGISVDDPYELYRK